MKRGLTWALLAFAFFGVVTAFAYSLKAAQGERFTAGVGIEQLLGSNIPLDAKFTNSDGKQIELGSLYGTKPVVLMFVFYRCEGTCAMELAGAAKLFKDIKYEDVGKEYDVITIGIHPKETYDLAATKKRAYLTLYERPTAAQGWHYLTGDMENIRKVTDAVGYKFKYDEAKDRIVHPTGIMVTTPGGRVSRYFYGVEYPAKNVLTALNDARNGQIGIVSNVLDFSCFQRDAQTGKVRLNVMNATKVAGLSTLLILITSIFVMTRKDKNSKEGHGA